ncbi:SulP family inorganic anion transporter [Micromonospora sp. 15K316]|uniref:SulP family inorganic anion transporter n=1 Tax=Micromonospora sp. 15K316 TaxID=2530376 RepID=UPI00104F0CB4|nr:SulP family inorganic anion transporter [Micromonospora sp. 15K316]TDC31878.1 SulP family inorganic anion transporter [Micromonospora sp. 15K316]
MSAAALARSTWHRMVVLLPAKADFAAMRRQPRRDLIAGLTVAVVALPLALGFGVSSGLGAAAGLATAIVAGILAALFGGSNLQVSGPTGAMTVVLVPIVARYGPGGVFTVGVLAGLILLALALLRAGRYVRYVPAPVAEGFTVGIAAVIFLQQVPAALGVPNPDGEKVTAVAWRAVVEFAGHPNWSALMVALGVAAAMLAGARWRPTVPFSLIAVAGATVIGQLLSLNVARIGVLPATLPVPSLGFLDPAAVPTLFTSALAVAALAALESLLSATVADGMTVNQRHDPDRELFGQGVANVVTPLFGGVPATAAIARTAVNVRSGAQSRLASLTHAIALAVIILVAAPLVAYIPLAALAGVLLATAVRMVEVGSLAALARATRSDALIMALTAIATLALDLIAAVGIGLVLAAALAIRKIANASRLEEVPLDITDHHVEEAALLREHIVAYRFDGPLIFAAAHRFLRELSQVADVRVIILRMSRVSTIDGTGARVLRDAIERLEHRGITVYVSGVPTGHEKALDAVGVLDRLRAADRVFPGTPEAIAAARAHLHRTGVLTTDEPNVIDSASTS